MIVLIFASGNRIRVWNDDRTHCKRPEALSWISSSAQAIGIFNGLGTKGVMIAPYYAEQMALHIVKGERLDEEVNVLHRQ